MPFDDLATDHKSHPSIGRCGICTCELLDVPHDGQLDDSNVRPQHHGIPAHQWARQRGLQFVPHQQQLFFDDRSDGLRELAMPFDDLAANQYTGPLDFRSRFCGGELCYLPHDIRLDYGSVQS